MITTEKIPNGTEVKVYWDLGDRYDDAGDGHVFMYEAYGESLSGHCFEGTGIICDGEFTEINDIEYKDCVYGKNN